MSTKKTIVRTFQFRSSRDAGIIYSTLLFNDGTASCNCPGWTRHTDKDGSRSCKHIIAAGIAPVSETAHSMLTRPFGKNTRITNKHGAPSQMSDRVVRRFNFDYE